MIYHTIVKYIYLFNIALISFLLVRNAIKEKSLQKQFLGFFVLLPCLLRLFLIK